MGGANGDETGYAIVFQLGNLLYLYDAGGVPGGYDEKPLGELVQAAKRAGVHEVYIEKNFGHGAHMAILKPLFEVSHPCTIEDDYSSGQKETRIVDTLEPLMDSHRLVINRDLIDKDIESTRQYPPEQRKTYQLFHQMSNLTRDKNSLKHDDRIEAVSSACRKLVQDIDYDYSSKLEKQRNREALDMQEIMRDPRKRREHLGVSGGAPKPMNRFSRGVGPGMRKW